MKKLLLLMLSVFALMACEGPTGPEGPMGPPGSMDVYVQDYTIKARDWKKEVTEEGFIYYICVIEDDNLNKGFYDEGTVTGALYLGDNSKTLLPYTENYTDKEGYSYIENYTFQYLPGVITFLIKTNSPTPQPPIDCTFQITMMY